MNEPLAICTGCQRCPSEIAEYVDAAREEGITPRSYVQREEGTFNRHNGHFLCPACYIKAGMPFSPGGWKAP